MFQRHQKTLPPQLTKNSEPEHPWARRIKDIFSHSYKHAHNTVGNPIYPKIKNPTNGHIKFTIIGDRLTEEFIYCVNLVRGLHKYRKKVFIAPVIKGVTTVEWPKVYNDLKNKYRGFAFCLRSSVAVLINDHFYGGETELKEFIETEYDYYLGLNYYKESVAQFASFINSSGRPCAYMDIKISDEHIGTLIFMLYADIVPNTCDNFLRLCKERRGGYSGTPIHRIVKDGWIQGGGYGLKSTDLDCENFIVPFDKRGVLGMANAARHVDCSTQFFVLLQPAKWMTHNFVAFGQLIEGKKTLEKIEAVPTWYESPNSKIVIYDAGIFNMDCRDIRINKGANEYIHGHIDDLNAFKRLLYEILLERVFLTAHLRELGEGEQESQGMGYIRETKRFNQNKEDIQKHLKTGKVTNTPSPSRTTTVTQTSTTTHRRPKSAKSQDNKDFDVETYDPENEEGTDYKQQSIPTSETQIIQPERPFYIPLTDVPYPGETDSHFNLRGFLQGDYCYEGDLPDLSKAPTEGRLRIPSYLFEDEEVEEEESDDLDTDEEKELAKYYESRWNSMSFSGDVIKEIAKGTGKQNIFAALRKSKLVTDEELRKFRIATLDLRAREARDKKVSISAPTGVEHRAKIKRRQTGFVHPEDLQKLEMIRKLSMQAERMYAESDDEDEDKKEVVIALPEEEEERHDKIKRRQTGFVRKKDLEKLQLIVADDEDDDEDDDGDDEKSRQTQFQVKPSPVAAGPSKAQPMQRRATAYIRPGAFSKFQDDDDDEDDDDEDDEDDRANVAGHIVRVPVRESVLERLLEEVKDDNEELPTLKHYKPLSELHLKKTFFLKSPDLRMLNDDTKDRTGQYHRDSFVQRPSFANALNLQHNKNIIRKVSSDYVKTIEQLEHHNLKDSLRAVEYSKTRPAITVSEYKTQNKRYQNVVKRDSKTSMKTLYDLTNEFDKQRQRAGIRLPGDSPAYSVFEYDNPHQEH